MNRLFREGVHQQHYMCQSMCQSKTTRCVVQKQLQLHTSRRTSSMRVRLKSKLVNLRRIRRSCTFKSRELSCKSETSDRRLRKSCIHNSEHHKSRSVVLLPKVLLSGDAGVLDKPASLPGMPVIEEKAKEKDPDKANKRKRPPNYNVLLHNDDFNVREYVVQVLLKIIPGMSIDIAVSVMNEAHTHGVAHVITCGQPDAEQYCEGLRENGLTSSIEPANNSD